MHIVHNNFETCSIHTWNEEYRVEEYVNCAWEKKIHVGNKTTLQYLACIHRDTDITLTFLSDSSEVTIYVYVLVFGEQDWHIRARIHAHLQHDHATSHIHLISFLPTNSSIHVDGGVTIHPDVVKGSGHLLEENIILGEGVQIKTLPMLDVQSNDVSASHGARIEKLDAKKLFYAQSRGLDEWEAKGMLVHGYIQQCFWPFITQLPELEQRQEQIFSDLMKR